MSETCTQVLIVGGGIVGLSASLFLSSQGIKSLLVERHATTSIHPRARGVNVRTMELFRELGVDEAVREAGASISASMGIYSGASLVEVIEPIKRKEHEGERKPPFAKFLENISPVKGIFVTQDMMEPALLSKARDRGGELRFNTEYIKLEQNNRGVIATLRNRSSGSESVVEADYVIAADGAGSQVRRQLGVTTTGAGSLGYLLNILFKADLKSLVRGREFSLCLIQQPEVRGLFASINNSDIWVFHLSYDPRKGEKIEDFPPQRCKELIKAALGLTTVEIEIKSVLPWEPTVRVVEQLQHGRIFLAGDAAHTMPPWGGQGATTGIADVHNLAWKIAAVLNGLAPPALLATYDDERLPIGRRVSEESGASADEYGLLAFKTFGAIRALISRLPRISGFGFTYTSQSVIREDTTPFLWQQRWLLPTLPWMMSLGGTIGSRAPHIWVKHKDRRISTLDLFGKRFVLIAGEYGDEWCNAAPKAASLVGVKLEAYRASPAGELVCAKGEWESASWISGGGAILIRPDGFIAWRMWDKPDDLQQKLTAVLKRVLCRDDQIVS